MSRVLPPRGVSKGHCSRRLATYELPGHQRCLPHSGISAAMMPPVVSNFLFALTQAALPPLRGGGALAPDGSSPSCTGTPKLAACVDKHIPDPPYQAAKSGPGRSAPPPRSDGVAICVSAKQNLPPNPQIHLNARIRPRRAARSKDRPRGAAA